MPAELLKPLRELRQLSHELGSTVVRDYSTFQHPADPLYYFRLPSKPSARNEVSVTPTCTAWMALISAHKFESVHDDRDKINEAYLRLLSEPWDTGRLRQNNAFTVAMLARSVGYLVGTGSLDVALVKSSKRTAEDFELQYDAAGVATPDVSKAIPETWRRCHAKSLIEIITQFLSNPLEAIALNPFPPSPTIAYWLIDAASQLEVALEPERAESLATWAAAEFRRQHSLVAAAQQAMMDPVSLAMAACTCKALRGISERLPVYYEALKACQFPSDGELESGIRQFFGKQNEQSGVWEKYFPIFHYPASGPNHCWHFEVLEAVVNEFSDILNDAEILKRLSRSLRWLEVNRLTFRHNGKEFFGWNGGGDIQAMRRGEPESWPTGVAHMFLAKLNEQLSSCIYRSVLAKLGPRVHRFSMDRGAKWAEYMDFSFLEPANCGLVASRDSVKKMIDAEVLKPAEDDLAVRPLSSHFKLTGRRSAVLFGPPGTSKTTLCQAVSKRLGWHYIELSPSDFLGGGLEGIYNKVTEIFDDLQDLYGVVILFDEMDALVQSRDPKGDSSATGPLDVSQQLLTTSMLPKLQRLNEEARVIFFMATNYIGTFDGAIIRSGRFDLLIHMGPPSTNSKIEGLAKWCKHDSPTDIAESQTRLRGALVDDAKERFDRFTFGEAGRFFYSLRLKYSGTTTAKAIQAASADEIKQQIKEWAESKIILNDRTKTAGALHRYRADAKRVSIQ